MSHREKTPAIKGKESKATSKILIYIEIIYIEIIIKYTGANYQSMHIVKSYLDLIWYTF